MMVKILLIFLISFNALAALSEADLRKVFLSKDEIGPISLEKIIELDDALTEIGMQDVIVRLQLKLDHHEFEFLPSIIHVCELEGDTLGTYQRGTTWTQRGALSPDTDIKDLRIYWEIADPEKYLEENYRVQIVNEGAYASLVVMEWPVICIRPGQSFKSVIATFVHEVEHFIGDEEKKVDYTHYESEEDYIQKRLLQSGGEYEAYQAGAQVYINLNAILNVKTSSTLMTFFDESGELINSQGLQNYILKTLDYKTKFVNWYRDDLVNSVNSKVENYNTLLSWFDLYEQNRNINFSNIDVYENNIKTYENNIKYYEYYNNADKAQEMRDKLAQAKKDIQSAKSAIIFYENLIELKFSTLNELDQEIESLRSLVEKVRATYQ